MNRVLHISGNQYPELPQSHHTKKIWVELAKGFDEYHVIARSKHNTFSTTREGNIFLHLVPAWGKRSKSFAISSFYIFYLIRKYKINCLLAQSAVIGGPAALMASKYFGIPIMVEIHGEEYFRYLDNMGLKGRITAYVYKHANIVRSLNKLMTEKLHSFGISENVVEVPGRVDLSIFNKRKENYQLANPLKLISVGRFVPAKNYTQLIRDLIATEIPFDLTLIGGGLLRNDYEQAMRSLGNNQTVKLIDWIEQKDMISLLTSSDIYIQYSVSEGMPRTILESMALAMPILTTAVGSIAGIIVHEDNGLIVNLNDSENLKKQLNALTSDDALRRQIAEKAYQQATTTYEWNNVFKQYISVIKSLTE